MTKRKFTKTAIILLVTVLLVLTASISFPLLLLEKMDTTVLDTVHQFNAAGVDLSFGIDEQEQIERLHELDGIGYLSEPIIVVNASERMEYCDLFMRQIQTMNLNSVIPADIVEILEDIYAANDELEITLLTTVDPHTISLLFQVSDRLNCTVVYDGSWDAITKISFAIATDENIAALNLEAAVMSYVNWFGLSGLYDWNYSVGDTVSTAHSTIAGLSFVVSCESSDEIMMISYNYSIR